MCATISSLPPVEKLFEMFVQVNIDCANSDEPIVSFDDTDFYEEQIANRWEDSKIPSSDIIVAAQQLKSYARGINYVLPQRKTA